MSTKNMDILKLQPMDLILAVFLFKFICSATQINGYDTLDPYGKIIIKWDVMTVNEDLTQVVRVNILNNQLFRHIESPGWKLSFTWPGNQVIWSMQGAETTEQGNCSAFKRTQKPHCCEKNPVIIDLLPSAPYTQQAANCCKGGVISSINQFPEKSGSGFQMTIGDSSNSERYHIPKNFSLGVPGYTCGPAIKVPPSKFWVNFGRRRTQALATYNVSCTYSQFLEMPSPTCCVSLSSFYNDTIIPCPSCSCGCQRQPGAKCVEDGETPPIVQLASYQEPHQLVQCTKHMCPLRVHWHIKQSYRDYWRAKLTVTNFNFGKNYSEWNLVVQHPNLRSVTQVFSFKYKPLYQHGGKTDDTGMFYGIQYYNDRLLQSGENGNVQTDILLHKDHGRFTFRNGWAFPKKISFNGKECVMPAPNEYPTLPNAAHLYIPSTLFTIFQLLFFLHSYGLFYYV